MPKHKLPISSVSGVPHIIEIYDPVSKSYVQAYDRKYLTKNSTEAIPHRVDLNFFMGYLGPNIPDETKGNIADYRSKRLQHPINFIYSSLLTENFYQWQIFAESKLINLIDYEQIKLCFHPDAVKFIDYAIHCPFTNIRAAANDVLREQVVIYYARNVLRTGVCYIDNADVRPGGEFIDVALDGDTFWNNFGRTNVQKVGFLNQKLNAMNMSSVMGELTSDIIGANVYGWELIEATSTNIITNINNNFNPANHWLRLPKAEQLQAFTDWVIDNTGPKVLRTTLDYFGLTETLVIPPETKKFQEAQIPSGNYTKVKDPKHTVPPLLFDTGTNAGSWLGGTNKGKTELSKKTYQDIDTFIQDIQFVGSYELESNITVFPVYFAMVAEKNPDLFKNIGNIKDFVHMIFQPMLDENPAKIELLTQCQKEVEIILNNHLSSSTSHHNGNCFPTNMFNSGCAPAYLVEQLSLQPCPWESSDFSTSNTFNNSKNSSSKAAPRSDGREIIQYEFSHTLILAPLVIYFLKRTGFVNKCRKINQACNQRLFPSHTLTGLEEQKIDSYVNELNDLKTYIDATQHSKLKNDYKQIIYLLSKTKSNKIVYEATWSRKGTMQELEEKVKAVTQAVEWMKSNDSESGNIGHTPKFITSLRQ